MGSNAATSTAKNITIQAEDTIAAIATPPGEGALGIVRVSGEQAIAMASKVFVSSRKKSLANQKTHSLCHGWILHQGRKVDEVMLAVYRSPASYTGEDTVEIIAHGGYANMRNVLAALLAAGARSAAPGEFTQRAFVNGKMDLAQAEAVMDLIAAKSDASLHAGLARLEGGLSAWVGRLRQDILSFYAPLEAAIDFPEEEIESLESGELTQKIRGALEAVSEILLATEGAGIARDGIKVAILGRPNAGKSSLFNALLMENRALVSKIPGTTRDLLEESLQHKGILLQLTDTAGLRAGAGSIESAGIARTMEKIGMADVLLYLVDLSKSIQPQDEKFLSEECQAAKTLVVFTKKDLPSKMPQEKKKAMSQGFRSCEISAISGEGLVQLKDGIVSLLQTSIPALSSHDMTATANERQEQVLRQAKEALEKALESSEQKQSYEVTALDLGRTLHFLGEITGETASDELLHSIFSRFCIGK